MKHKCLIKRGGRIVEIKALIRIGDTLTDKIGGETYGIVEEPYYMKKGNKYNPLFICNEATGQTENADKIKSKGVTVELPGGTNPQILNAHSLTNIIDGKLFQTAFRLKIEFKTLLLVLFFGGFLGTMVGLMI